MASPRAEFEADPTRLASSAASSSAASDTRTPPGSMTEGVTRVKPGKPKGIVANVKEFNRLWNGRPPKYESSFLVHKHSKTKRDSASSQDLAEVAGRARDADGPGGTQRLVAKDARSGRFYFVASPQTAAPLPASPQADMEWFNYLNDFGDLSPRAEAAQQAEMAREWGQSKDKLTRDMSKFELYRERRSSMIREIDDIVNKVKYTSSDESDTQGTKHCVSNKLASLRGLKLEDMLKDHRGGVF